MKLRAALILAILASLGAGGLGYFEGTKNIPALTRQRDKEHFDRMAGQNALREATDELEKTKGYLFSARQALTEVSGEYAKAVSHAKAQDERVNELSKKIATAFQERDDAQGQLVAYQLANLTPDQIVKLSNNLKDANAQIMALNMEKAVLARQLARVEFYFSCHFPCTIGECRIASNVAGKVLCVDPKWDFVVLNIGEDQGAMQDGELLVSRDGKLVAKVVIRSVQKDRCVANIVPGWKLGEMIEGDTVTPAHPAT
jgi:hypothetical protein